MKSKKVPSPTTSPSRPPYNPGVVRRAGFFPRLQAWCIDAVSAAFLVLVAGYVIGIVCWGLQHLSLLPVEGEISMWLSQQLWFSLFLAGVLCSYFVCYWCLQGRTPGMHLARLRVQNTDGSPLRISQALIRLGTSAFGLGNVMVIFDSHDVMAFQDYWAKCEVIKAR